MSNYIIIEYTIGVYYNKCIISQSVNVLDYTVIIIYTETDDIR